MESTKSNLQENQKKSYQCKPGQQGSLSIDDCASCIFYFVHISLCYYLLVKFLRRLQLCANALVAEFAFLIVLCNFGINPYLYAWRLPQFKRAFCKFLHLKARTKFSDIATTSIHATGKRETSQIPETLSGEDIRVLKLCKHKHIIICILKTPEYSAYLKFIRMSGERFWNNLLLFLSTNITLSILLIPAVCRTCVI